MWIKVIIKESRCYSLPRLGDRDCSELLKYLTPRKPLHESLGKDVEYGVQIPVDRGVGFNFLKDSLFIT